MCACHGVGAGVYIYKNKTISKMKMSSIDLGGAISTFAEDYTFDGSKINSIFSYTNTYIIERRTGGNDITICYVDFKRMGFKLSTFLDT